MFDVITVGSATRDIFVETDKAQILSMKSISETKELFCLGYGDKIEIDHSSFEIGGGAVNTGVNFSGLGLHTSVLIKTGDTFNGKAVRSRLKEAKVDTSLVMKSSEHRTGFSVILTSFEGDRTVLAHRGANGQMKSDEINWEALKNTKWIYSAPLSNESNKVLDELAVFVKENNIKFAYNPGGTGLKRGLEGLKPILEATDVVVMNKTEASKLTGIIEKSETKHDFGNNGPINKYIKKMLIELKKYTKLPVVTDGKQGVIAYDGDTFYFIETFPAKVTSTLGAGDAFSSTFVGCFVKSECDIEKSMALASINAASVVGEYGAQQGLKTFKELEEIYNHHPEYKPLKVK